MNSIESVKQKREFSGLPDSVVEKALNLNKQDVKKTRAFLRKYFGVFMTNKVLKGVDEKSLENHISSKKRDYKLFYKKIMENVGNNFKSVIDLGCGVNGFSYPFLFDSFGKIRYVGVEATRQLCDLQNEFFRKNNFNGEVVWGDVLDFELIERIISKADFPRLFFMFQVVDAMESVEPNSSKVFISKLMNIMGDSDVLVVSNPVKSISGRNNFKIRRRWLEEFLLDRFEFVSGLDLFDEEFLILKKKNKIIPQGSSCGK
jgi:hypothetical protein